MFVCFMGIKFALNIIDEMFQDKCPIAIKLSLLNAYISQTPKGPQNGQSRETGNTRT